MFNRKKKDVIFIDIGVADSFVPVQQLEDEGYIVVFVHGDPNKAVSVLRS